MSEPQKKLDYGDIAIRGRMDIEDIVRLQINRCNASGYEPDQTMFESSVKVLLDLLPYHKRLEVLEKELEYKDEVDFVEYGSYWCGQPMTSTRKVVNRIVLDFHKLYRIVLDAFADCGLTWQIEPILVEEGKEDKNKKPPKPLLIEEKQDEQN